MKGGIKRWTCPKCGRTFKRQGQDHYCGKAPETVDGYIAGQPEELREVRYLDKLVDELARGKAMDKILRK